MKPLFIIFLISLTGTYSIESYNYPPPSNPLESTSSLLNQGYNYQPPSSASEGIRSVLPGPSRQFDNSVLSNSNSFNSQNSYYDESSFASNSASTSLPRSHDYPFAGSHQRYDPVVAPSVDVGVPEANGNFFHGAHSAPSEQVKKHIYVYVAPTDPVGAETKQSFIQPPAVNHKIIFIKAPTQSASRNQVVALPPKTQEKTLVYVLVKKPEEHQLDIQSAPPPVASKPEVYFIKYNTKKESDPFGSSSGSNPAVLPPNFGLPSVEDSFRSGNFQSSNHVPSQSSQGSPAAIYGPAH